ncbi:TSUP family transporter, partial [Pseudomonas aeruginosa]
MDVLLFESLGIGAVLGLLLGLTGAGGSLVALPLLLSLHLPLRDAIGVSLGAVALSALIGAIPRARQGQVAWRPVLVLALAGLPSLSLRHISEPTGQKPIWYAVFGVQKKEEESE